MKRLAVWGERLRTHPAAKSIHHAYRGGLLEHTVSMAELGHLVAGHYPELNRDLLLLGVLFHDLGKILELGAMPANDYTLEGRLVGHVVIGRDLLRERCAAIPGFPADLQLQLEHLVLSHQGTREFGAVAEPMTPEAQALHFIDDLDSKMNQLRQARAKGPALQWHHTFRRYIYFLPPRKRPSRHLPPRRRKRRRWPSPKAPSAPTRPSSSRPRPSLLPLTTGAQRRGYQCMRYSIT
jgi:3'-5' exoribonuclease